MSQTSKTTLPKQNTALPVIVFGIGTDAKPVAGLFPPSLSDRAIKAATQLRLSVLKVKTSDIADVAKRIPTGRINASGKGLVPPVRQPLYEQVLKAAGISAPSKPHSLSSASAPPAKLGLTLDFTKIPLNEVRRAGNPVGSDGLPRTWKDIGANHLVLVQESQEDGWHEALVVARDGDMLTVRWRNYPKYKPFTIHADAVALLNASPSFKD